jgi:hypothetical protein
MVARQVAHRLDILGLAVGQLLLKCLELGFQYADVAIDVGDVFLDALDVLLMLIDFGIDDHEILQALLHIGLVLAQGLFLLAYLRLYLRALTLQSPDGTVGVSGGRTLPGGRSLFG